MSRLAESKERFVQSWGEMASRWGINKTMARIHAHLMASEAALSTDEIMETLAISRGNANMNLRSLVDWGLVRRVSVGSERKEYFQSEKDVWNMCCRIARERKKGTHAFAARRRAIERLGLPQVRAHRLRQADEEERAWTAELSTREAAVPDLAAILLVHIVRAGSLQ